MTRHSGTLAALAHRLSGLALAIFLPIHFLALGKALQGARALDSFLAITSHPAIKAMEAVIVVALAIHLTLGLRVLAIEFLAARERTAAAVSVCFGAAFAVGIAFLLNAR